RRVRRDRADRHPRRGGLLPQRRHPAVRAAFACEGGLTSGAARRDRPSLLESIKGPRDLDGLTEAQFVELAAEIRAFLIREVSQTGGHLGPNLGVVELTLAIHRVFDSPKDAVVFDTGHQSYVHKLLTGRQDFSRLRVEGGLAGYPQ